MESISTVASTRGGIMTEESGAITGELELRTLPEAGLLAVSVRYAGADEWYTVSGSPVPLSGKETDATELHERVVACLNNPGAIVNGNEEPASLHKLDRL